jgi:hypothetical protein
LFKLFTFLLVCRFGQRQAEDSVARGGARDSVNADDGDRGASTLLAMAP